MGDGTSEALPATSDLIAFVLAVTLRVAKASPYSHSLTVAVFSGSGPSVWTELRPMGVTQESVPEGSGAGLAQS